MNTFRDVLDNDVKETMEYHLSKRRYENFYGYTKGAAVCLKDYICYAYFSEAGANVMGLFVSAIYTQSWPEKEQNLYFEYMFDKKLSPWRDLLPHLDYDVVRGDDGLINGAIIYTTEINKFVLFHFLKNIRQIYERSGGIFIWTEIAKELGYIGEGDYSDEVSQKLQDAFCIAHMFSGSQSEVYLDWGHEHKIAHGFPVTGMFERQINLCDLYDDEYYDDAEFADTSIYLSSYVFGQLRGYEEYERGFNKFADILCNDVFEYGSKVIGYFLQYPTQNTTAMFTVEEVKGVYEVLADRFRSNKGYYQT